MKLHIPFDEWVIKQRNTLINKLPEKEKKLREIAEGISSLITLEKFVETMNEKYDFNKV
jgi:hypothetical protein